MLQFMFRSRRTNLTRKLLKARKTIDDETSASSGEGRRDVHRLLSRLQENQLAMLWRAVESRGKDYHANNCVLVQKADLDLDDGPHHHHVLLSCQTWRWPDLVLDSELRRLPGCRSRCDPVYVCCNPYHWSRIHQPSAADVPPPPYSRCPAGRLISEDIDHFDNSFVGADDDDGGNEVSIQSIPVSLTTNGSDSWRNSWCKLAYWELAQRVGPFFPVESSAVNIFGNMPFGDGLSLEMLSQQNETAAESVKHARCKIGLGVTLSHESGGRIWLYNRSDNPIFVNSLTLDNWRGRPPQQHETSSLPTRVPAERCLCVYDPSKAIQLLRNGWTPNSTIGPIDPNSIRISFAKGWGGPKYTRQEITSCPCWLEVLLAPCR